MQLALILSVVAPALAAAVLLLVGVQPWRREDARSGRWAIGLIPGAGALAAYVAVRSFPELPPVGSSDKLLWIGLLASAYGAVESLLPASVPPGARWVGRAALCVATPAYVLSQGSAIGVPWIAGGSAVMLAAWAGHEHLADRLAGPPLPAALAALGFGVATATGTQGSALLAQTAGGVTVGAAAILVAALILRPKLQLSPGLTAGFVVLLGGVTLAGHHFAEVTLGSVLLLAVAALAPWIFLVPRLVVPGFRGALVAGGLALVLAGGAVGVGLMPGASATDTEDPYGDPYAY